MSFQNRRTVLSPVIGVFVTSELCVVVESKFVVFTSLRVYPKYAKNQTGDGCHLDHMRCGPFRNACERVEFELEKH